MKSEYPMAVDPKRVGTYPALTRSGGGMFYDEVLEYRVWIHPEDGDDYFRAFGRHEDAARFSDVTRGAEQPLVLVLQHEWIIEPTSGCFEIGRGTRVTEWNVEWLKGSKRKAHTISRFMTERQRRLRFLLLREKESSLKTRSSR